MDYPVIWDPLRKKEVPLTPEERVRQWFIGILGRECGVPGHMMMSEVEFSYGSSGLKKIYRADIVVYDRKPSPVMIVECKRPEVEIDKTVMMQALRYDAVMGVRFIAVTNGRKTCICRKADDGTLVFLDTAPNYTEMTGDIIGKVHNKATESED